jgi:hypothetical protein
VLVPFILLLHHQGRNLTADEPYRIAPSDPLPNLLHTLVITPDLGALEYKELLLLDVGPR